MVNILGERSGPAELTGVERALDVPGVSVHIYGKAETRIDRKMGHITAIADTVETALAAAQTARKAITI
jgi:5-(carboxyamino)imidazole ribonucleotide synthase